MHKFKMEGTKNPEDYIAVNRTDKSILSEKILKEENESKIKDESKESDVKPKDIKEVLKEQDSTATPTDDITSINDSKSGNKITIDKESPIKEEKETKEQYSREQLLNAAEVFCKYNSAAYYKDPIEQRIAQERALAELKAGHSEREIAAAINVSTKRNAMSGLKDRINRINEEYKTACDNPSAETSTVKAKYDQQIQNIKREMRLIDNDYNPLLRELKIANLDSQLKNLEKYRDHADFKEKTQDAELFALSMIQTEMIRYQDAKVSSNSIINPEGWDHVKNFFKRGAEGLSKNKLFGGYMKMGRGKRMALNAAMIGAATALWLPASVAAGASAAAFVGYKMARSLMGGTFGYFLSKKVFQPLARKAYEHDSARTTQEQQNEALSSSEMAHLEQLARGETDPTEREKILGKIADFNIELCASYSERMRRDKKYFIANNVLGTVVAGGLGGLGARYGADWLAGPGMLGIFPAHGGGTHIPSEQTPPHKGGGVAPIPGEENIPKGGGDTPPETIIPPKPVSPEINPEDMKAATIGKGEGIEHALRRQLEMHPDKFGFKGDLTNKTAIHEWSGGKAHLVAIDQHYVNNNGTETWVKDIGPAGPEGNPAYVLDVDATGKPTIQEYFEGKPSGAGGPNSPYEYMHDTPTSPRYTSALDNVPEQGSGNSGNDWNTPEQTGNGDVIEYGDNSGTGIVDESIDTSIEGDTSPIIDANNNGIKINPENYTIADKTWINNHSWLAENNSTHNLPIDTLKEMDSIHSNNTNFLNDQLNKLSSSFGDKQEITEKVNYVLTKGKADSFIGYPTENVDKIYQPLHKYINILHDVTGLNPIGETLLQAGETNSNFITRALMDAAEKGVLDKVKL